MNKNQTQFFKDFLQQRKQAILENLHTNFKAIQSLRNSSPSDSVDFSTIEIDSQIDSAISTNLKQELQEIEESLSKIENGIYGICESCDDLIDTQRLKIKPHAKYCIACRQSLEKGEL